MQNLTDPPRDAYTEDQITALIQAPDLHCEAGCDLLDTLDNFVEDISADLSADGNYIDYDATQDIQGSCTMLISRELVWGVDRIRPYMLLSSPLLGLTDVRFNLGIFVTTTPDTTLGDPQYSVTGYDKMYFLTQPVQDTVVVPQGGDVLTQVADLIAAATNDDPKVNLDTSAAGSLLVSDQTWPLASDGTRYLDVINWLLAYIGYMPLWCDQDGYYTSSPIVDPSTLSPEWEHKVQDTEANIVADPRVRERDVFSVPNWWRFVQNGLSVAPAEGAGQFTYQDNDSPLTGYGARGYFVNKIYFIDAVDQATLQLLAQLQIIADTSVPETWSITSGPLPQSGHYDIINYTDNDIDGGLTARKCQVQNYTLYLNGDDMESTMITSQVVTA